MRFRDLQPDFFVSKIEAINLLLLRDMGYNSIIFDLDNTLVGWRAKEVRSSIIEWLRAAEELGFKMCIVSNCLFKNRVRHFSEIFGIPYIFKAVKPRKKAFMDALCILGCRPSEAVVIGDQVFTDVFGGNRMGFLTILVAPIDKKEFYATLLQRTAEKILLSFMRRRGILKDFPGEEPAKKKDIS